MQNNKICKNFVKCIIILFYYNIHKIIQKIDIKYIKIY